MPVTLSPRLGIRRWSAGTDPFTRAQMDADHATLDDLSAIDVQGTLAARPAAGVRGRYYFATDTGHLYRDTGVAWVEVLDTGHIAAADPHTQYHNAARHAAVTHTQAMMGAGSVGTAQIIDGNITAEKMAATNLPIRVVTAATRPAGPATGLMIYETDTKRVLQWDGAAWIRLGQLGATGRTGVSLRRNAQQTVGSNNETTISWDTEDTDTDGFIAVPSGNVIVPAGLGGLYGLALNASLSVTSSRQFASIIVGGISYRLIMNETDEAVGGGLVLPISAGVTVNCTIYQLTGANAAFTARFHMYRLGA